MNDIYRGGPKSRIHPAEKAEVTTVKKGQNSTTSTAQRDGGETGRGTTSKEKY
jgi:hypothetical protein